MTQAPRHRIDIEVQTSYIEAQSAPEADRYVFSYTVTIRNKGMVAARLLGRHWIITDANGKLLPLKADPYGALHEPPPGNSSIVFQSAFQWSDSDWRDRQRSGPKLDAPTSIYEVHLGSWMRVPGEENRWLSYTELAERLGVTWLWRAAERHLAAIEALSPLQRAAVAAGEDLPF